jgi:hypothetical protein
MYYAPAQYWPQPTGPSVATDSAVVVGLVVAMVVTCLGGFILVALSV